MAYILKSKDEFIGRQSEFISKHWLTWLRWSFVLVAPLVAAGLGFIAAKRSPKYALVAAILPVLVVGAEIVLRNMQFTPVVILLAACFVPFSLPTGTESRLVFSLVFTSVFVGLWLVMMFFEKRLKLQPSPINLPLLVFALVVVVSFVWSIVFRDPMVYTWRSFVFVQLASTLVMVMLPGALLLSNNHINDLKIPKLMVAILFVGSVMGLLNHYYRIPLPINSRGLFGTWIVAFSVSLVLNHRGIPTWGKTLLLGQAAAWFIWGFILNIGWLAGWLPIFVALGVVFYLKSKKLLLFFATILVVVVLSNPTYYWGQVFEAEKESSGDTRLAAWQVNWRVTSKHWLFGTGPGGYAAYYMTYFPFEGVATHNNYLDILAQTGTVGFTFFIILFITLIWMGFRVVHRTKGRGDLTESFASAALAGTLACILIMGFGDWLFPFAYTQSIMGYDYAVYNFLFMAFIPILDRLTQNQTHEKQ
jgi:hypothetical protein